MTPSSPFFTPHPTKVTTTTTTTTHRHHCHLQFVLFLLLLHLLLLLHAPPIHALATPGGRLVTAGERMLHPPPSPHCVSHIDPFEPHLLMPMSNCTVPSPPPPPPRHLSQSLGPTTGAIRTDLRCLGTDDAKCAKVRGVFEKVASTIEKAVWLSTPIKINATFYPICKGKTCSPDTRILGAAAPTRSFLLLDDDGLERAYPQSLVKQFDFPNLNFNYDTYDITAQFNSETNFWFTTDPQIQPGQIDLEFLVLHEFIHGLGFLSLWRDYFDRNILTPCPLTPASATKDMVGTEHFIFQGFIESAFDRHILDRTLGTNLSDYTRRMSAFSYGPGTTFKTLRIFLDEFLASSQSRMARRLFRLATTPNAMAFQSVAEPGARSPAAAGKRLSLETSIRQYRIGSTITHFDYGSFTGTSDFLMRWLIDDGVSLHDAIARSNVDGLEHTGSEADGIGPGVLSVLESLGYRTLLSGGVSIYKPKLPPLDHLTMTNAARRVVGGMETWAWMVGVVMVWTVGWGW